MISVARRFARLLPTCALALHALAIPAARAEIARFDTFSEGSVGSSFTDGGITFFDADNRFAGTMPPVNFIIEDATDAYSGIALSLPNVLTLTGYEAGPQAGYSRMGELKASVGGAIRTVARADVFYSTSSAIAGNTISLEVLRDGIVVGSDSITLPAGLQFLHRQFEVLGVEFDTVRLIGRGNADFGCFFGSVDNVELGIPAPGAAASLVYAMLFVHRRRRPIGN